MSGAPLVRTSIPGGWSPPRGARRARQPRRRPALAVTLIATLFALPHPGAASTKDPEALVRTLRERALKINGFSARVTVQAGGVSQSGTLLFLAPGHVHMEMQVSGLGEQRIVSDGRTLWTITPQARLATKIDLVALRKSWGHSLPDQATAIRDIFAVAKPGTARFVREEDLHGTKTRMFEAVPEIGIDFHRDAALPDRMRVWVGEDGILRRQVLMKGVRILMDAAFEITDRNPHLRGGLFTFFPPSDYQVQDLTESTLRSLRSLAPG